MNEEFDTRARLIELEQAEHEAPGKAYRKAAAAVAVETHPSDEALRDLLRLGKAIDRDAAGIESDLEKIREPRPVRFLFQTCCGLPPESVKNWTGFESIMALELTLGEFDATNWQVHPIQLTNFGRGYFDRLLALARQIIESGQPVFYLAPHDRRAVLLYNANHARTRYGPPTDPEALRPELYVLMPGQNPAEIEALLRWGASEMKKKPALAERSAT